MRFSTWGWLALIAAAAGCQQVDDGRSLDATPPFESAMYGALHAERVGMPDGIALALGDSALTCAGLDPTPDGSRLLLVEVWNPSIGDCPIGDGSGDGARDGCVSTARVVRTDPQREPVTTRASVGVVRIRSIGDGMVAGEIETEVYGGVRARCSYSQGTERPCTCEKPDGSTWTCTHRDDEPGCCYDGDGKTVLKTAFEATSCESACAVLGCGVDADCSEVEACLGAPPGGG